MLSRAPHTTTFILTTTGAGPQPSSHSFAPIALRTLCCGFPCPAPPRSHKSLPNCPATPSPSGARDSSLPSVQQTLCLLAKEEQEALTRRGQYHPPLPCDHVKAPQAKTHPRTLQEPTIPAYHLLSHVRAHTRSGHGTLGSCLQARALN